jgi:hypothetical protein
VQVTGVNDRQSADVNAGVDTESRHNPHTRSIGVISGRRESEEIEGYLSLNDVAHKANISIKHIRKHLGEIPHYRFSKRGKIWLRWPDFEEWMESRKIVLRSDDSLLQILRDMTRKARS